MGATKTAPTKAKQAAMRASDVFENTNGLDFQGAASSISQTQVEVQNTLASLSARLIEQIQVLKDVEASIRLKQEEMQRLHGVETAALELENLRNDIAGQRESWKEEQSRRQREFAEQQADRHKAWARQEEEYTYKLTMERKKAEDAFAFKMAQQERANKDHQTELEKDWARREAELKGREDEVKQLREQVANIPELVRKAENAAAQIAGNSVKKEYETKVTLLTKDMEMAQKLFDAETVSLRQTISKQNDQIEALNTKLEQAQRDIKEISGKALESASDRVAMQALRGVLEKDQGGKPQK